MNEKKTREYFSHDYEAISDPSIVKLRARYGMEGYGLYWAIVEMLYKADENELPFDEEYLEALAYSLHLRDLELTKFIPDCVSWGLVMVDEERKSFYSPSVKRRIEVRSAKYEEISNRGRKAVQARWNKEKQQKDEQETKEEPSGEGKRITDETQNDTPVTLGNTKEKEKESPAIARIPTNKKNVFYSVTQEQVSHWKELYPAVNVLAEIKKMQGWCESNPTRRKTMNGVERFITGWLSRSQNNPVSAGAVKSKGNFEQRDYPDDQLEQFYNFALINEEEESEGRGEKSTEIQQIQQQKNSS